MGFGLYWMHILEMSNLLPFKPPQNAKRSGSKPLFLGPPTFTHLHQNDVFQMFNWKININLLSTDQWRSALMAGQGLHVSTRSSFPLFPLIDLYHGCYNRVLFKKLFWFSSTICPVYGWLCFISTLYKRQRRNARTDLDDSIRENMVYLFILPLTARDLWHPTHWVGCSGHSAWETLV